MAPPLDVLVWVDFLDPWSWITSTRVDRLQEEFGDRIAVGFRAFLSVLEPQTRTADEYRPVTTGWLEPAAKEPALTYSVWSNATPPTHSAPAQVAARVAEQMDPARADAYRRRLFEAHFAESRTISESSVLIALAGEVGLRADDFAIFLRSTYADQVKGVLEEHREALRLGIIEPPGLVTGGYLIRGAAAQATYRELIRRLLAPPTADEAAQHGGGSSTPTSAKDDESAERDVTAPDDGVDPATSGNESEPTGAAGESGPGDASDESATSDPG